MLAVFFRNCVVSKGGPGSKCNSSTESHELANTGQCYFGQNPWTARRSNQSILMDINAEYSLEGLMLKLKLQYFDHPMQRPDSLEKTLMLGKIKGRRRRGCRE